MLKIRVESFPLTLLSEVKVIWPVGCSGEFSNVEVKFSRWVVLHSYSA